MIKTKSFAAAALLAASTLATAAPAYANGNSRVEQRPAQTANAGDRRVCVRDSFTGTRVARPICKTQREWIASEGAVPSRN